MLCYVVNENDRSGKSMADIKTNLRELSVATIVGLLSRKVNFQLDELYDSKCFWMYARQVISGDISSASNISKELQFTDELKQIIDNGYRLAIEIINTPKFIISENAIITWVGNDTQKEDPIDITVGKYGFSLKEDSFILENMGLYKLLNCYTGSAYKKRHIFSDYAREEYECWFATAWNQLLDILVSNNNTWSYHNISKHKKGIIILSGSDVKLEYFQEDKLLDCSTLPKNCSLASFEKMTSPKTREQVFSKFIKMQLADNEDYIAAKKACAIAAAAALVDELKKNLNYAAGLPRFLRIHQHEYYYAKTTNSSVEIFKVPAKSSFGNDIVIESIEASVPDTQANILTTIKNKKTGNKLVLRNECRFSHGQFNGTLEAKMYYANGSSLEAIYEKI